MPQPVNCSSKDRSVSTFDPFATPETKSSVEKQAVYDPFATPSDKSSVKNGCDLFAAPTASSSTAQAYDPFATPETSTKPFDPFAVPDTATDSKHSQHGACCNTNPQTLPMKVRPALPAKFHGSEQHSACGTDKKALPSLPPKPAGSASGPPALPSKSASGPCYREQPEKGTSRACEARSEREDSFQHRLELQAGHMAGDMVAKAATNEENQRRAGAAVASAANDEERQKQMGRTLASQTDNKVLQSAAQNRAMQRAFGRAVGAVATNKTVQRKAGQAIADQAQDEENQQALIQKAKSLW